jgi:hypothetical protein
MAAAARQRAEGDQKRATGPAKWTARSHDIVGCILHQATTARVTELQPKRALRYAPRIAAGGRDRFGPRPTWGKEFSPNPFSRGPLNWTMMIFQRYQRSSSSS